MGEHKKMNDTQINNIERRRRAEQEQQENEEDDLAYIRGLGF